MKFALTQLKVKSVYLVDLWQSVDCLSLYMRTACRNVFIYLEARQRHFLACVPQQLINCQSTTLFISGMHSNIHCEKSWSKSETTAHRQAMVMWTLQKTKTNSRYCLTSLEMKYWVEGVYMPGWTFTRSWGGMHAKKCFNHLMCMTQRTGSKRNRVDVIRLQ